MAVAVVGAGTAAGARVAAAPDAFVRHMSMSDIARSCRLLDPPPRAGRIELNITPAAGVGRWHVDIGGRDRPRLLAAITGALADKNLDIVTAVVATWADGTVLDSFVVRSPSAPDANGLSSAITAQLGMPPRVEPITDALVSFTNSARTTNCDVRAKDRPGLLGTLSAAFAAAGADIHTASINTVAGQAVNTFELSDRKGNPLDAALQAQVRSAVIEGQTSRSAYSRLPSMNSATNQH